MKRYQTKEKLILDYVALHVDRLEKKWGFKHGNHPQENDLAKHRAYGEWRGLKGLQELFDDIRWEDEARP